MIIPEPNTNNYYPTPRPYETPPSTPGVTHGPQELLPMALERLKKWLKFPPQADDRRGLEGRKKTPQKDGQGKSISLFFKCLFLGDFDASNPACQEAFCRTSWFVEGFNVHVKKTIRGKRTWMEI
jgi:hypothetical protein